MSDEDRAAAARYFRASLISMLELQGLTVTEDPGVNVARLRTALTDVAASTWWQKLHPVSRVTGAGTGGAAMEAEVRDSITGEQLAAVVQSATGDQFDLGAFSTLDDVKSAIDKWTKLAGDALSELRARAKRGEV